MSYAGYSPVTPNNDLHNNGNQSVALTMEPTNTNKGGTPGPVHVFNDRDLVSLLSTVPKECHQAAEKLVQGIIRQERRDLDHKREVLTVADVGLAASKKNMEIASEIVKEDTYLTLLQWSAIMGWIKIGVKLVNLGSDILQTTKYEKLSILMLAAYFNQAEFITAILSETKNEDMKAAITKLLQKKATNLRNTLEIATIAGNEEAMSALFRNDFYKSKDGKVHVNRTLINSTTENESMVMKLVNLGAEVNDQSHRGIGVIHQASIKNKSEIVEQLLEHKKADINLESTSLDLTALMFATQEGHLQVMKTLLAHEAIEVDKVITTGCYQHTKSALTIATAFNRTDAIDLLLRSRASLIAVNPKDKKRANAFTAAITSKNLSNLNYLLESWFSNPLSYQQESWFSEEVKTMFIEAVKTNDTDLCQIVFTNRKLCLSSAEEMKTIINEAIKVAMNNKLQNSLLVFLEQENRPKITDEALKDLKSDGQTMTKTLLHTLASTCMNEEIIKSLQDEKPFKNELKPTDLALTDSNNRTVVEYICDEDNIIQILQLQPREFMDKDPETKPFQDEEYNTIFTKCAAKNFMKASANILDKCIQPVGWGLHDENLTLQIDLSPLNDASFIVDEKMKSREMQTLKVVAEKQPELLKHPVMKLLMNNRWRKFPKQFYSCQLLLSSVLAVLTTFLIVHWKSGKIHPKMYITMIVFLMWAVLVHLVEAFGDIKHYAKSWCNNLFQLVIYLAIIGASCAAISESEKDDIATRFRTTFSWTALLVLAVWLNLLLVMRKSTRFGLYIIMFTTTLTHFIKLSIPLGILLGAFSFTFGILYHPNADLTEVSDPLDIFMKILSLSIGSVDADETGSDKYSTMYVTRAIMMPFFVLMIVVLTMNLLIGIVIDDVRESLKNAQQINMILRIQQIYEAETFALFILGKVPFRRHFWQKIIQFRRCFIFEANSVTVHPNRPENGGILKVFKDEVQRFSSSKTITKELLEIIKKKNSEHLFQ